MFKRLMKTKTFWGSLAAILAVAERVATGNATIVQGLQIAIPAVLAIFIRDGIAKQEQPRTDK